MRARIALQLASMIPIDDKEEEARIVQNEVKAVSVNKGRPVSEEDIIDVFHQGDEVILSCPLIESSTLITLTAITGNRHYPHDLCQIRS
jgi:hypothetical protein